MGRLSAQGGGGARVREARGDRPFICDPCAPASDPRTDDSASVGVRDRTNAGGPAVSGVRAGGDPGRDTWRACGAQGASGHGQPGEGATSGGARRGRRGNGARGWRDVHDVAARPRSARKCFTATLFECENLQKFE
jgi:hypothetical protein